METNQLTLLEQPGRYAICRLPAKAAIPEWCWQGDFCSLTRTMAEVSIVCQEELVPVGQVQELKIEPDWRMFKVAGELDFSLTGVIAGISSVLAAAGLGIFVLSTFNTDYILVKSRDFEAAGEALRLAGYRVAAKGGINDVQF